MKSLRAFVLIFGAFISSSAFAKPGDVTLLMPEASVSDVLKVYGRMSGQKISIPEEVAAIKAPVKIMIKKSPVEEALDLIEEELLKQVAVRIVHEGDGTDSAKKSVKK